MVTIKTALYYTPDEVKDLLGVSLSTIYNWIRADRLPAIRIGFKWRIPVGAIDAFLAKENERTRSEGWTNEEIRAFLSNLGPIDNIKSLSQISEAMAKAKGNQP